MKIRFVLGPAGSGRTFRCLTEVRAALAASPGGPPLVMIAPKQTTYQLERQFLAEPSLPGYTRLQILSFERLAGFVLDRLGKARPDLLEEEGRLMVLRGLLAKKRNDLKLFRASARLTGFAQQLSLVLREFQRHQQTPESLFQLAAQLGANEGLSSKLHDLAVLMQEYLHWLQAHRLQDADQLLPLAAGFLVQPPQAEVRTQGLLALDCPPANLSYTKRSSRRAPPSTARGPQASSFRLAGLWVDGFAEFTEQEIELLAALLPLCEQAAVTFCLEGPAAQKFSWLSTWSVARRAFEKCQARFEQVAGAEVFVEVLPREANKTRFLDNPVLSHLEAFWATPAPFPGHAEKTDEGGSELALRLATCVNPEAEATLAAREILRHVRKGGRYRDVTVLVRKLECYHEPLQRVFGRYGIPLFLDRREAVSHHPLAELTRSALRTVESQWLRDDWFAALKTGLVPAQEVEIDRLENEALARGWRGADWQKPVVIPDDPELTEWLARLHERLLPPFHRLSLALAEHQNKPTGPQLAAAVRRFWQSLNVEEQLEAWAAEDLAGSKSQLASSVHATVWGQMNAWLANVELAFPSESLTLREWLPVLEAGLANLSVGVIPPALDQVFVGGIDRSRNPDIKLALVLGLNESVFPAAPEPAALLNDADRLELEKRNVLLATTARQHLARERYLAYLACTRARERVVLTHALHDADGAPLNPSPFLTQVRQLFPSLEVEVVPKALDWRESEHVSELIGPLLTARGSGVGGQGAGVGGQVSGGGGSDSNPPAPDAGPRTTDSSTLLHLPAVAAVLEQLKHFQNPQFEQALAPELAAGLYGPVLRTSVSRMEQFAACPFRFFVHSGLRAEERKRFELDAKEQGSFQHDVLALFHEQLEEEGKHWRDVTPAEARRRVAEVAAGLSANYRDGLLHATEQSRFLARVMVESLQDFVGTLVDWMRGQYRFDPTAVELPFGEEGSAPAWALPLKAALAGRPDGEFAGLELCGRIDRVDLCREPGRDEAFCVVVDYKSSHKHLDPLLMAHGLQLQLLTYLNVLRHWPDPRGTFGVARLIPAGVFYVNLRGQYESESNRIDALKDASQARKLAYVHSGRFDARALPWLDARPDARRGDQFNYRLTNDGELHGGSREALATGQFEAMLDAVEANLRRMGDEIFSGVASVAPYRKGATTACDQCAYKSICRIDPWTHNYRVLKREETE